MTTQRPTKGEIRPAITKKQAAELIHLIAKQTACFLDIQERIDADRAGACDVYLIDIRSTAIEIIDLVNAVFGGEQA